MSDVYRDRERHPLESGRAREEVRACKGHYRVLLGGGRNSVACRSKQLRDSKDCSHQPLLH